jgi:hypothetical protein
MKRIVLKQVRSSGCFLLNMSRQLEEQAIEGGGGRNLDHRYSVDQLTQRFSFGDPSRAMISVRGGERIEKFLPIKTGRVTKSFKAIFRDLNLNLVLRSLSYLRF